MATDGFVFASANCKEFQVVIGVPVRASGACEEASEKLEVFLGLTLAVEERMAHSESEQRATVAEAAAAASDTVVAP